VKESVTETHNLLYQSAVTLWFCKSP